MTFFFFSSRRRHTRFDCDWSSDVCSSDLLVLADFVNGHDIWMLQLSDGLGLGAKALHVRRAGHLPAENRFDRDRKSTRLNSSHSQISYAVFCLKKKKNKLQHT